MAPMGVADGSSVLRPAGLRLVPRSQWALIHWDSQAMLFVRRDAVPAAWLKEHEYTQLFPDDWAWIGSELSAGRIPREAVEAEVMRYLTGEADEREKARVMAALGRSLAEPQ